MLCGSPYYESILSSSRPGSAKLEVFENHYTCKNGFQKAVNALIQDSDKDKNTLLYANPVQLVAPTPSGKTLAHQAFALKMDDSVHVIVTLALQKDSEFLPIFNHYILKGFQSGEYKKLYRTHHIDIYTNKNFEMIEAQPLGLNNVMFCFMFLGFGICLSIIIAMMEFMSRKLPKRQGEVTTEKRRDSARWATSSTTREVN